MIELNDVSIAFQGKQVLSHFSLSIEEGSTVAILGESGIGKSTILKILLGLLQPDAGELRGMHGKKRSAVFQEERLCEYLSAITNVQMVLSGTNRETRELAKEHLKQLIETDALSKPVRTFSGGMKRRVSIVRAFAYPSDLICMDEPFNGLDAYNKQKCVEYMMRHKGKRTIVLVTHDVEDAYALNADRLIYL